MNAEQAKKLMMAKTTGEIIQALLGSSYAKSALAIAQKKKDGTLQIRAYDSYEVKDELKALGFRFGDDFNGPYWEAVSGWNVDFSKLPDGPEYKIL